MPLPPATVSKQEIVPLTRKTVDLRKKMRSVTADPLKSKSSKLEVCNWVNAHFWDHEDEPKSVSESSPDTEKFASKLENTTKKFFEVHNQNVFLKNELKLAHKYLQQEIGEDFDLAQVLSGKSKWRGRAQQIKKLQTRIIDLNEKLGNSINSVTNVSPRLPSKLSESFRKAEMASAKQELENWKTFCVTTKTQNKNLAAKVDKYKFK